MSGDKQAKQASFSNVIPGPAPVTPPAFRADAAWALYMSNFAVAETVDIVAASVARLRPRTIARRAGFDTSPVTDILDHPGLNRTRYQLVREVATRMVVTGTAYILLTGRHDRPPLAIDVVDPTIVNCVHGNDGWPTHYRLRADPAWTFSRVVLTRSNLGFINPAIGELVPILEMAGNSNGLGLSRLTAIWPLLIGPRRDDDAIRTILRRRFGISCACVQDVDAPAAAAARSAFQHDVILPLFSCIYAAFARALTDRWNEDIEFLPEQQRSVDEQPRADVEASH